MAENVANFYLTTVSTPSIFEIIAQKSLNETLQPAVRKVADFLAACNPRYCGWLSSYYDEAFLGLNAFLQYYYLKQYSASFSEYFYGLKRVRIDDYEITKVQKQFSWIYIVIYPYIKKKIEDRLMLYRIQEAENVLPNNSASKLKRMLLFLQSTFEITWGSWILINYLRYMSNQTDSQTPALKLLNLKLTYSDETSDNLQTFWSALLRGELSLSELSVGLLQNAVRSTLEMSAFFVQFLQVWNNEKTNYNVAALPTVEPPEPDTRANHYRNKCPICLQPWVIPTVLPVSGYVFCFPCIFKRLKETGKCPVTGLPAKPFDIIRLYQ